MEFYWDYTVASLIKDMSEKVFSAETNYDEKTGRLTVSVPIGEKDRINLLFYDKRYGFPALAINRPHELCGNGPAYIRLLKTILEWRYRFMPEISKIPVLNFEGHGFVGWKPNGYYRTELYLWNDDHWNMAKINKLILGLSEKENEV